MSCSVMQKNLEPPTLEQLKQAFSNVPGLTAVDAALQCRDAFGILARSFEPERAQALQSALAAQGVETEVVEDASLPALPELRIVHRLDSTPDALMICDPLGRSFPLPWKSVLLIAAGKVRMTEFKTVDVPHPVLNYGGRGRRGFGGEPVVQYDHETHEEHNDRWLLEVVITGAALRYSVVADRPLSLLFQYLGDRRTIDVATNFKLVVQDLTANAPEVAVNRGAYYLRENSADPFYYPTKKAFYDEMTWLLWKMK
jgi:hypothetical protein